MNEMFSYVLTDGTPKAESTRPVSEADSVVRCPITEPLVVTSAKPMLSANQRSCLPFLSDFTFSRLEREHQVTGEFLICFCVSD